MIGTAVVVSPEASLLMLPNLGVSAHAKIPKGTRVVVACDPKLFDIPQSLFGALDGDKNDWELVRWGDRVGWVTSTSIKRDPLLAIDASRYQGHCDWSKVVEGPYALAALKATQGTSYKYVDWYGENIVSVRAAAGDRWGDTFNALAYHYYIASLPGSSQARYHLSVIRRKGVPQPTVISMLDVERGSNPGATKSQVIHGVCEFIDLMFKETGQRTLLYGGEFLRALGIVCTDFCTKLVPQPPLGVVAEYADELKPEVYTKIGYGVAGLAGWQYAGDEDTKTPNTPNHGRLPHGIPGFSSTSKFVDTWVLFFKHCQELVAKIGVKSR